MTEIYALPSNLEEIIPSLNDQFPDGWSFFENGEPPETVKFLKQVKDYIRYRNKKAGKTMSSLLGEEVRIPWADGEARYIVAQVDPNLKLWHLPLGDAWDVPDYMLRGLTVEDVKDQVKSRKAMTELFGGH